MLDFLCVLFIVTFQKGFYSGRARGLAVLTVSLITAGGAAINDCFDRDSDALTHPERPVASHKISPAGAAQFSALMFLLGLGTAFAINFVAFGIVAVNVVLFIAYPRVVKRFSGFLSNLVMGYLGATVALFAGAVVFQTINVDPLSFVGLIAGGAIGFKRAQGHFDVGRRCVHRVSHPRSYSWSSHSSGRWRAFSPVLRHHITFAVYCWGRRRRLLVSHCRVGVASLSRLCRS